MKKSLFYTLIVSIFIVACQIDEQELEPLNNIDEASSILIIPETEIDVLIVVSERLSDNAMDDGISISNKITEGFNMWNIAADNSDLNIRLKNIIGQNPPIISWLYNSSAGFDAIAMKEAAIDLREFYKADIVIALTDGHRNPETNARLDYVGSARGAAVEVGPDRDNAFAVVDVNHVSNGTFVHEVGHLLGADHQEGKHTTGVDKARALAFTTSQGLLRQTIMHTTNTPANRILYFSNPEIAYEGYATGNSNANNASVINGNAELVASFSEMIEEESACEIGNRIDNLQLNTVGLTYYLNNFPSNANWEVVSGNMTIQSGGNSSSVIVSLNQCFTGGLIKASAASGNACESIFSIDPVCAVTITDLDYLSFSGSNSLTFIAPIVKSSQANITSSKFLVEYENGNSLFYFPTVNSEGNLQTTIPVSCSNKIKKITATVNGLDICTGETCSGSFVKDYFFGICGSGGGGIGIGFN